MDRPKKIFFHSESSYLEVKVGLFRLYLSRLFFLCTCKCIFNFWRNHSFILWNLSVQLFIHLKYECLLCVRWKRALQPKRCLREAGGRGRRGWWPRGAAPGSSGVCTTSLRFYFGTDLFIVRTVCRDDVLRVDSKKRNSGSKTIF